MTPLLIKPAPGLAVPDPELGDVLPADGRDVSPSEYGTRRLAEGAVVNATAGAAVKPATDTAPAREQEG